MNNSESIKIEEVKYSEQGIEPINEPEIEYENGPKMVGNFMTVRAQESSFKAIFITSIFILLVYSVSLWGWINPLFISQVGLTRTSSILMAWSAMLVHADLSHFLGNILIFTPFSILLLHHFSLFFFPVLGFVTMGLCNLLIIQTMNEKQLLLGLSGLVFWMGFCWLTLFFLIDLRKSPRQRLAIVLFAAIVLFSPEAYKPEISYLSHVIGSITGLISGLLYYSINKKNLRSFDIYSED